MITYHPTCIAEEPICINAIVAKNFRFHNEFLDNNSSIADNRNVWTSCSTKAKCSIISYYLGNSKSTHPSSSSNFSPPDRQRNQQRRRIDILAIP